MAVKAIFYDYLQALPNRLAKLKLKCIIKSSFMLICLCHPASDRDIDAVIDDGARSVSDIGRRCGAGTGCGACVGELKDRLVARGCHQSADTDDCRLPLVSLRSR
jgi:bacterioferritin-associated ferredoxin